MVDPSAPAYDEFEEDRAAPLFDDDSIASPRKAPSPACALCFDSLAMWGGPVALACGHSLCCDCLQKSSEYSAGPVKCPLCTEIEEWVPVSIPPMDAREFEQGLYENGDISRLKISPDKKLGALLKGMKRIVSDARKKQSSGRVRRKQSLYAMTSYLEDVQVMRAVFEAEPPMWLPDSSADACSQCCSIFKPITCGRHHCRFCGNIFCNSCSGSRSLLPPKFRVREPQRVCDTCANALEPAQRLLAFQVSHACQAATHDVTDYTCARSWLNSPLGFSMEQEIYKATNTLREFFKASRQNPEMAIPDSVLKNAKGLAILSVLKFGMGVTYKVGTGLVVARHSGNTWSAPSAIASCGMGWGLQVGGELTDYIIVLRNEAAVKAFSGRAHLSLGAGMSLAAGPVGRVAEADIRSGDGGIASCYTYSYTKGAFIGCSLEGNLVVTRTSINSLFYGDTCVTAKNILSGCVPQPRAAIPLYDILSKSC